ncbi:MAG: ATP-binding cassette domain-containing protein [Conexivisphaerales archaeon]
MAETLVEVKQLVKYFEVYSRGIIGRKRAGLVHAVDNVSFYVKEAETFALVGESGCGKTTTAKVILNLEPPTSGEVYFKGINVYETFSNGKAEEKLKLRRNMQLIFQNPYSSLDPRMTVYDILVEPFVIHKHIPRERWKEKVYEALDQVTLEPYHAERYPHEFSGGQRQRIAIARALVLDPALIIADEPVSSLDVSIRAQILNLMMDLQKKKGISYIYISHDLSSVRQISHRIGVMYLGEIVEMGNTEDVYAKPLHPYTQALMSAVPIPDPTTKSTRIILPGEVPSPINPPPACRFHPRCPYAQEICRTVKPPFEDAGNGHMVACHFWRKFA